VLALSPALDRELVALLAAAVRLAETTGQVLVGLPDAAVRDSLEQLGALGDRDAAYTLGRGVSGMATTALPADVFAGHQNMRKRAAFLMRAADAGCVEAWMCLYRLHADHQLLVANPQLARFFLEKAALRGLAEAQRRLGALVLRESTTLAENGQAIAWLHQAGAQDDCHASALLYSLVLPVDDNAADAAFGIEQVRRTDAWLAMRLSLARAFGLTKLEALTVDPVEGARPRTWWSVRTHSSARSAWRRHVRCRRSLGPHWRRCAMQPCCLANCTTTAMRPRVIRAPGRCASAASSMGLGIDEALYFSDANATTLEALRLGAKWAFRSRLPLRQALMA
jgi:hypothetical protein